MHIDHNGRAKKGSMMVFRNEIFISLEKELLEWKGRDVNLELNQKVFNFFIVHKILCNSLTLRGLF